MTSVGWVPPGKIFLICVLLLTVPAGCVGLRSPADEQMSLVHKSHVLLSEGRVSKAEKATEMAISQDGATPFLLNQMALIRDRQGHPEMSLRILAYGHRLYPRASILTLNLATEELAQKHPHMARQTLVPILDQRSWPNGFRTLMGRVDLDTGHLTEAALLLHEALDRHPGNPLLLATMGLLQKKLGQDDKARENFRKALDHAPPGPLRTRLFALLESRH